MLLLMLIGSAAAVTPTDLVGTWNVKMTANYSTCSSVVSKGDITAQQWAVSVRSGALVVKVVGEDIQYVGAVDQSDGEVILAREAPNHLATVELSGTGSELSGRRVVANSNPSPCAIIYDIQLEKQ